MQQRRGAMGEGQQRKGSSGELSRRGNLSATAPAHSQHKTVQECVCGGDEREGEGLRGGGGAPAPTAPATYTTRAQLPRGLCRGRKRAAPQAMRGGGGGGGACCSSTILSSRCQRLRMACSVRPGMRCAMRYHLCPISRTDEMMIASSACVHPIRSGFAPPSSPLADARRRTGGAAGLPPSPVTPVSPAALRPEAPPLLSPAFGSPSSPPLSRDQRLRTASSERPCSCEAMRRQR
mmetsp:Transcript_23974/g.71332  ORF Transcript_23974/g.71332 Transcript_23974/m.71332 type:complete len:235 (-) Transcript_23974:131-835(-)